jgi:LemA protein
MVIALVLLGVFGLLIIGTLLYVVNVYNQLVELENRYENAFAQIEVQLKRRHDLIPNLVETAKGYLEHEQETLQNVTEARNQAQKGLDEAAKNPGDPDKMNNLAGLESMLSDALGQFMVTVEDYPELQASENMQQLHEELSTTENKISFARQAYNDAVMKYNTYRESFPAVVLAPAMGHTDEASHLEFEDSEEIQDAPDVSF